MATLLLAGVLSGCDKPPATSEHAAPSSEQTRQAQEAVSLFAGTKLMDTVPIALDINRAGNTVFVQFLPRDTPTYQIISLELTAAQAISPQSQVYASESQSRAFVRAHPSLAQCLLLANDQPTPHSPVVDTVWRAEAGLRTQLSYLELIPEFDTLPPDACYGLEPCYSWDGATVVIPLKGAGVCLVPTMGTGGQFVPYPPIEFEAIGITCQPLPDQNGRRVALLRWTLGEPQNEHGRVDILNLETTQWEAAINTPWPVYEIAASDIVAGPWLLVGSRFPELNTEKKRVPRLMRADPASGALDLVEFHGQPYWNVRLDATGEYVVYMDTQRQALIRLKLATGELDIDKSWFEPEAKVFASPGAEPVYAWLGNVLHRAAWTAHEQVGKLEGE